MKKIFYITACLFAVAVSGCNKPTTLQIYNTGGTRIKFFHAAPGVPALDAYVNGVQITPTISQSVTDNGASSTSTITTGYYYKSGFPGSTYAIVPSGNVNIKVLASQPIPALLSPQTITPGTVVSNNTISTTDTDAYSIITAGLPGSSTTPLTSFVINDVFPAPASGMSYIRYINLIPNAPNTVYVNATYTPSTGTTALVTTPLSGLTYGAVSKFVPVPVNPSSTTSYSYQSYYTGGTTTIGGAATIVMTAGRYYTLVLYGLAADYPVPGTSITLKATARPTSPLTDPTIHYPEIYFNVPGLTYYTNK
jgi:hypothetical protein